MVALNGGGLEILSAILISIEPQRFYCLFARFLFGELCIAAVHGMAPQDAVDKEPAPPFGEGVCVPVAIEEFKMPLVWLSAFIFIALAIMVDNLCF